MSFMGFDSSALCCLLSCWSDFSELCEKDWYLLSQFHVTGPGQPASGRLHGRELNADWTELPWTEWSVRCTHLPVGWESLGWIFYKKTQKTKKQCTYIYKLWLTRMWWCGPEQTLTAPSSEIPQQAQSWLGSRVAYFTDGGAFCLCELWFQD